MLYNTDGMNLFLHACQGVFTTHTVYTGGYGVDSVFGIDLNGDGFIDLASASYADDTIRWYENDGNGNFLGDLA